jgi:hypothetical protein
MGVGDLALWSAVRSGIEVARPATLIRVQGTTTKDGDEWLATVLLRSVLDVEVERHDDGSRPSMYDLTLTYRSGRRAAAEVVSTRERQAIAQHLAAHKLGYTSDRRLSRSWRVLVADGVNVKRVRHAVRPLLLDLERDGVDRVGRGFHTRRRVTLKSIGVETCWSFEPVDGRSPGFYLWPTSKGWWVGDGEDIVRALDRFLPTVPDVPAKLRDADVSERHVVVVVTVDQFDLFASVDCGALPSTAPVLPPDVDHLWLVTLKQPPIRAVYWLGDGSWRGTTLTAEDIGMSVSDL